MTISKKLIASTAVAAIGLLCLARCAAESASGSAGDGGSPSANGNSPSGTGSTGTDSVDSSGMGGETTEFSFTRSGIGPESRVRITVPEELLPKMEGTQAIETYEEARLLEAITVSGFEVPDEAFEATEVDCGIRLELEWAEGGLATVRDAEPVISTSGSRDEVDPEAANVAQALSLSVGANGVLGGWEPKGYLQVNAGTYISKDLDEVLLLRECLVNPTEGGTLLKFGVYDEVGYGYDNNADGKSDPEFNGRADFSVQPSLDGSVYINDARVHGFVQNLKGKWVHR